MNHIRHDDDGLLRWVETRLGAQLWWKSNGTACPWPQRERRVERRKDLLFFSDCPIHLFPSQIKLQSLGSEHQLHSQLVPPPWTPPDQVIIHQIRQFQQKFPTKTSLQELASTLEQTLHVKTNSCTLKQSQSVLVEASKLIPPCHQMHSAIISSYMQKLPCTTNHRHQQVNPTQFTLPEPPTTFGFLECHGYIMLYWVLFITRSHINYQAPKKIIELAELRETQLRERVDIGPCFGSCPSSNWSCCTQGLWSTRGGDGAMDLWFSPRCSRCSLRVSISGWGENRILGSICRTPWLRGKWQQERCNSNIQKNFFSWIWRENLRYDYTTNKQWHEDLSCNHFDIWKGITCPECSHQSAQAPM